ncbi:MAG: efflux RND transporter periplasmic adaptor subunit [Planctomycetaceae bacterium]|nr:efflux RND transporter periplasmic adaptor subunit [Planctomycetaceae bacterium]
MKGHYKALLAAGLIAPATVFAIASGGRQTGSAAGPRPAPTEPPRSVRVVEVRDEGVASEQAYTGVIRARYESDLAFRVGGKVIARHVEVGERVKAGQPLFRLDPEDYELAVKEAEADLIAAEAEVKLTIAEHERRVELRSTDATSLSEFDKTLSDRDVAVAKRDRAVKALALARNRLSYCTLAADADGVVTALPAEAGQVVADGQPVARLARDGGREAVVSLPENRVVAARSARARVTLWSTPGVALPAELRELSPAADPVTRTYQARFAIPGAGPAVELGMTATVHLTSANAARGFVLPLSSLSGRGGRPAVWVVGHKAGRPTLTPVEVREYRQESVVIADGLKPGELVVTAGVQKIDSELAVLPWEDRR